MVDPKCQKQPTAWRPLLKGADRAAAIALLEEIAAALLPAHERSWSDLPAWLHGTAGIGLFFAYLERAYPGSGYLEAAEYWLSMGEARSSERPTLLFGFTGLAWTIAHVRRWVFSSEEDSWSDQVDCALLAEIPLADERTNWDLVMGLAGSGVYFLERLPDKVGYDGLSLLVDYFERTALWRDGRVSWLYHPDAFFFDSDRALCPRGLYNLTLAHGIPAVLGVLAGAGSAGVEADRARRLLDAGVRWLLDHEQPDSEESAFPTSYERDDYKRGYGQRERLAWCRGDAGIAATLLSIAQSCSQPAWEEAAIRVGLRAAARGRVSAKVEEPGLCHGAMGLAHLFNRNYQRTGLESFGATARKWFREGLRMRRADMREAAGIWSWQRTHGHTGDLYRRPEPSFLLGAAGVGLALLAAVTDIDPQWDRVMLATVDNRA